MALINTELSEASVVIPKTEPEKEMLSVRRVNGRTLVRVNSSSISLIQECPRKANFVLNEKWRSESESPATLFGSAIHKALEVFYSGDTTERKLPKLETMELMAFGHPVDGEEEDLLLRSTKAFVTKAEPLRALPETDKRHPLTGVWLLHHYFKTYLDDPYIAHCDPSGAPYIERDFTFRLFENEWLEIDYFGRIDLIVRHAGTGEVLVCDHKTSSVVGADFYSRLKPNLQYCGYVMGAQRSLGLDVNNFMVNCLQSKQKPITSRGSPPHLPRQVTSRDVNDYVEFTDTVVSYVKQYLNYGYEKHYPMGAVDACAKYGGCQYLQVCSAPKSMRDQIMKSKFIRGESVEKTV